MDIVFFLKGLVVGFFMAAPIGPMGNLCIHRTLSNGRTSGLISGLGAVTADGLYSAVAAYGLTVVSDFIASKQHWFSLVSGIFLVYLGIRIFLTRSSAKDAGGRGKNLAGDYVSALFITLANPLVVIAFVAIFAGLGIGSSGMDMFRATGIVLGVVSGSALCWALLSLWVGALRRKMSDATLNFMHKTFGTVILMFAAAAFYLVIKK